MDDLIVSGCFGEHLTENCAACRASRLVGLMVDLRRVLSLPCPSNSANQPPSAAPTMVEPR